VSDEVQSEQTIAAIHQDVKDSLRIDDRLRQVEVNQAGMGATVKSLETALPAMESRLIREIQDTRPKNVPAWIAVGVASLAVVLSPIVTSLMQR